MSHFRLTPRAVESLTSIFSWTIERFGEQQAADYRDALIERCQALANGRPPHGRLCDLLLKGYAEAAGLLYAREGGHFILFRKEEAGIVVIDFVHERRDLPRIVERLARSEVY